MEKAEVLQQYRITVFHAVSHAGRIRISLETGEVLKNVDGHENPPVRGFSLFYHVYCRGARYFFRPLGKSPLTNGLDNANLLLAS